MIESNNIEIIFIACVSRSGSTLLDHMLSNSNEIECVGELSYLNEHLNRKGTHKSTNWLCTCGEPLEKCNLWSKVINIYQEREKTELTGIETFVERKINTKIDILLSFIVFFAFLPSLRRKLINFFYMNKDNQKRAKNCLNVHHYVALTTGKKIILDSSKRPEYLYGLLTAKTDKEKIKVVHLTRDARAVSHSLLKRRGENSSFFYAILSWLVINVKILNLKSFFTKKDYIRVRYEDICMNPDKQIKLICDQLSLPYDSGMGKLSKEHKHNIGGSPHRFEKTTEIKLDEKWKALMSLRKKIIYYLISWPLNKFFGY